MDPEQKTKLPPQRPPEPQWHQVIIWVLIPLVLMVWNIVALWPKTSAKVDIPYSAFLAQIQASNVAKVHIAGDQITGTFVKPIVWPKPQPNSANNTKLPAPPPNPEAKPKTKPSSQSRTIAPATYSEFATTFPSVIGDSNLISLLEAHKIVIDVSRPSRPWAIELLANWGPMLLLIGFFWWMAVKAAESSRTL